MLRKDRKNNYMCVTGRLAFIFLLLFVLAVFAEAFHHHEDGCDHNDCPVCAAAHHNSAAGIVVFSLASHQPVIKNEISSAPLCYDPIRVDLLSSRAPPV